MTHEATLSEAELPLTLEGNIAFWEQRIDRLATEVPGIAGSNQYPEWYYQDNERLRDIVPQLQAEGADIRKVSKYYELYAREAALQSEITGHPPYSHPLQQVAYKLGEDLLGKALRAEPVDGPLHAGILDDLNQAVEQTSGTLTCELDVLKAAYGFENATQLLGIGGDEYSQKLRTILLNEQVVKWIRYQDQERGSDFMWRETQQAMRTWMSAAVEAASGMPATEATDYVFTASRRGEDEDIISIIKKFDHFGVDRIRQLATSTGIHGLEAYSIEQLERMEEFATNPAAVAERLTNHDVMTVLINRFGDHNGVFRTVASDFDDDTKRVLFFEITSMNDINKRMIMLRAAGIKPSTLVLAAHSAPGQFIVADVRERDKASQRRDIATVAGRKLVAAANAGDELDPGDFGYSMHGMKGIARLVETYMQPSRAIDDNDADAGRKKIIFQACEGASETAAVDLDEDGEKVQTGMQSVITQFGTDLIASGVRTSIDIYGAPGGIQLHRNDHGVRYTGQPTSFDMGRPHLPAIRVRVQNGKLTKQEVHDIPLRKAD